MPTVCLLIVTLSLSLACQTLAPQGSAGSDADQTLTLIVARLQVQLRDDPYRAYPAAAANGQTVFASVYSRIQRLQDARLAAGKTTGDVDTVLLFAASRALERMRRFDEAARGFEDVAASATILAPVAAAAAEEMRSFAEHSQPLASLGSLGDGGDDGIRGVEARIVTWRQLVLDHDDSEYEPLARVEAEAWEILRVELLTRRHGPEGAIAAARRLIERNRDSKLLAQHLIRLGDLYADAARREYLQHTAWLGALDVARYDSFLGNAFASYELAKDDRTASLRREAATKIEALLAYHDGVRSNVR